MVWFLVNLGRAASIDGVHWYMGNRESAGACQVQFSAASNTWQTVATLYANAASAWQEPVIGRQACYVRWLFSNPTNVQRLSDFAEVEVYGC